MIATKPGASSPEDFLPDTPLVEPRHRHLFRALVRLAFERPGNNVGKTLKPIFTRTQLRRLASDNAFSLDSSPSMLTVRQWVSVFDLMISLVPQDRWPPARRDARRERRR